MPEETTAYGKPSMRRLIWEDSRLWRELMLEQEKSVSRKENLSGAVMETAPILSSTSWVRKVEESGMAIWTSIREKEDWGREEGFLRGEEWGHSFSPSQPILKDDKLNLFFSNSVYFAHVSIW